MAVGLKPTVANSEGDALFNATAFTGPATLFVKLHIGDPGAAGTSSAAANTTRKSIDFGAYSAGSAASVTAQAWTSVPNTETYTHMTIWDDVSAGNFLASGTVSGGAVTAGNDFTLAIGAVTTTYNLAA